MKQKKEREKEGNERDQQLNPRNAHPALPLS